MEITLNSDVSNKTIRKKIKKLYLTAFPAEERAPFFFDYVESQKRKRRNACCI